MTSVNVFIHQSFNKNHKLDKQLLGKLLFKEGLAYLEFEKIFLEQGVNISPLNLILDSHLQRAPTQPFNGLHGVFADSLPDGWGLLLMNRQFRQRNININNITPLDRLTYMGDRAMGALSYEPDTGALNNELLHSAISITEIAEESLQIFQGSATEVTQQLNIIGGSPGGARPKATIGLDGRLAISGAIDLPENFEHWLVKFPTGSSPSDLAEGAIEYIYSIMAKNAHIDFPETQLIPSQQSAGYFACKRFDRKKYNQRIHMHSFAGLINADFRVPDADYELLMKATSHITKSHLDCCEVLRRMIFNILSGNRDDHTKNFSFLMSDDGTWNLSPAYDVTFNLGINGHHSMSVAGFGENIPLKAIQKIASMISLSNKKMTLIIEEVVTSLLQWRRLAKDYDVPTSVIDDIEKYISANIKRLM